MKKLLTLILVGRCCCAAAQTINPVDTTTIHTVGTNVIKGDQPSVAFSKINSNFTAVVSVIGLPTNSASIVGWISDQQYISALQTNVALSSMEFVTYTTNYAFWGASNYLGRFAGSYDWNLGGGDDGGNPPMPIPCTLVGSFTGTNNWFTLTNNQFTTSSNISLAVLGGLTSGRGAAMVTPGSCTLFSVDHWELLGRTNSFYGQHFRFSNPINSADPATKEYADGLFYNAFNANFATTLDSTNNINHYTYSFQGIPGLDIGTKLDYAQGISLAPGAGFTYVLPSSGQVMFQVTNVVISIAQTNLLAGWQFQTSTNLELAAGFTTSTNYLMATNSGIVTFTVTIDPAIAALFFRIVYPGTPVVTIPGLLALQPRTVTNSTDSTFGLGAGMVLIDTNYVYVSAATNRWKRAALSAW